MRAFVRLPLLLFALLWGGLFSLFLFYAWHQKPSLGWKEVEAVAVVTGDKGRVQAALSLKKRLFKKAPLLISGFDFEEKELNTFGSAKGYHVIASHDLTFGTQARNTLQNIEEIRVWMEKRGIRKCLLLSSDYHMPRLFLFASRAGLLDRFVFYPLRTPFLLFLKRSFLEFHKFLYYYAFT